MPDALTLTPVVPASLTQPATQGLGVALFPGATTFPDATTFPADGIGLQASVSQSLTITIVDAGGTFGAGTFGSGTFGGGGITAGLTATVALPAVLTLTPA